MHQSNNQYNEFPSNNEIKVLLERAIKRAIDLLTKKHPKAKYINYAFDNRTKIAADIPKIIILLRNLRESFKNYYNKVITYIKKTYNGDFDQYILKDLEEMKAVFTIIENLADNASKKYIDGRMQEQLTIIIEKFESKPTILKDSSNLESWLIINRYNQNLVTLIENMSSIFDNLNTIEDIKKKIIKRCNISGNVEAPDNVEITVLDGFENLESMINIISLLSSLRIEKDISLNLLYVFRKESILLKEIFDHINDTQKLNRINTESVIVNAESFKLGKISKESFSSKLELIFLKQSNYKDVTYMKIGRAADDLCDSLNLEDILKTQDDTRSESYLNIFSRNRIKTEHDLKKKTSYCSIM